MSQVKIQNTDYLFHLYIYFFHFQRGAGGGGGGEMKNHNIIVTNPKRSRQVLFIIIMFDLDFT